LMTWILMIGDWYKHIVPDRRNILHFPGDKTEIYLTLNLHSRCRQV